MDFTPFLNYGIELLAVVLVAIAGFAYRKLASRFDWLDELDADVVVEDYIERAIAHGKKKAKAFAEKKGKNVDLGQPEVVDTMVNYIMERAPKALKKVGFTRDRVRELLLERLE